MRLEQIMWNILENLLLLRQNSLFHLGPTVDEMIGDNEIYDWKKGDLVEHDVFGKGVVVKVQGNTLDIAFSMPYGIKTLMSQHKALRRLSS